MSAEQTPTAVRPPDIHAHRILILDFGAQYTQLIARRVRECGVYCEIHPWDMPDAAVREFGARGIILSGGPESVTDAQPPKAPQAVFDSRVPVLGICYGMQTMAQQLGGRVTGSDHREFGYAQVTLTAPCRLFDGLRDHSDAQGHAVLVEIDDDHLQADARDFLGFDADDLADTMGRINHEIAGLEPDILVF